MLSSELVCISLGFLKYYLIYCNSCYLYFCDLCPYLYRDQSNHNKLSIMEALRIKKLQPSINNQCTGTQIIHMHRLLQTLLQQSPHTSHSAYPQNLISHSSLFFTISVLTNLYTYPVTGPYAATTVSPKICTTLLLMPTVPFIHELYLQKN